LPGKVFKTRDDHLQCCPRATGWAGLCYKQVAYLFGVSGRLKSAERICTVTQHTRHATAEAIFTRCSRASLLDICLFLYLITGYFHLSQWCHLVVLWYKF
jgi:hypothetical protein